MFGKVVAGTDVVDAIEGVRTGRKGVHDDVPLEDVVIQSVEVVEAERDAPARAPAGAADVYELQRRCRVARDRVHLRPAPGRARRAPSTPGRAT